MGDEFDQYKVSGSTPSGDEFAQYKVAASAPGTVTGNVASIGAMHGTEGQPSPGLQYSRGYSSPDVSRKFSGGAIDRSTSYLGENLRQAFNHPIDTVKNALMSAAKVYTGDTSVGGQLAERYRNDPAAALGDLETQAMASTVMGKPPGINLSSGSQFAPEGVAHPLQGIQRGVSALEPDLAQILKRPISSTIGKVPKSLKAAMGNKIQITPVDRPAPLWQTDPTTGTEVPSILSGGEPPVNMRTTYPQPKTPVPPRPAPAWQQAGVTPTTLGFDWQGSTPEEIQAQLQRMAKQTKLPLQPAERVPLWQTAGTTRTQPGVGTIASTPEEIQAQLQRMANRPRTSRPEGAPNVPTPEATPEVQNIPLPKAMKPTAAATVDPYRTQLLPKMQKAPSTAIEAHGYDPAKQQLVIHYRDGRIFRYSGVPDTVADAYMNDSSHGSFARENIQGRYQTEKLGQVAPTRFKKVK